MTRIYSQYNYRSPFYALGALSSHLPEELHAEIKAHLRKTQDDDASEWPDVPYCYTQGRNQAYSAWLESLAKDEQEKELAAVRGRYAEFFLERTSLVTDYLRERGLGHVVPDAWQNAAASRNLDDFQKVVDVLDARGILQHHGQRPSPGQAWARAAQARGGPQRPEGRPARGRDDDYGLER